MSAAPSPLHAAVAAHLGHSAMSLDDPLNTVATDAALHACWPASDAANYRQIARELGQALAAPAPVGQAANRPAYRRGYVAGWQYGLLCGALCGGLSTGLLGWLVWLAITAWQCPTC